jgi:hypothetical protein
METAGILIRRNQGKLNAWRKTKDTVPGDFEDPVFLAKPVVLLSPTLQLWNDDRRV